MEHLRQWSFIADMNSSGTVTISDVWLWVEWLYFYPGDWLIYVIIKNSPGFATFFEIDYATYGSFLPFLISFLAWAIALFILYAVTESIAESIEDWRNRNR